jgi:hypothetical protein
MPASRFEIISSRFHNFTVLSSLAVAKTRPSGDTARLVKFDACAFRLATCSPVSMSQKIRP